MSVGIAVGVRMEHGRTLERTPLHAARTVRLFLEEGRARGLTIAEVGNWSGKVLAAPRQAMLRLLARPESSRTGVYILMGADPERPDGTMVYIGEADNVGSRLKRHLATGDNDFFEQAAIVVGDASLTKAHGRFLEAQLIRETGEAGGVSLFNRNRPDFRRLPEADLVDMESFLDQLRLVLPLLGFDLYRAPLGTGTTKARVAAQFVFATAGARATGREEEEGFVVLAGSTARRGATETFPSGYLALRDQLLAAGRLTGGPTPDLYAFAADVVFSSPSAAASIVAARSASGPIEWKLVDTGQSYRDWSAERFDATA